MKNGKGSTRVLACSFWRLAGNMARDTIDVSASHACDLMSPVAAAAEEHQ